MQLLILKISYSYSPGRYNLCIKIDSSPRAGKNNDDNNNLLQDVQITRIRADIV